MAKRITYLLGAGASCNSIPTVEGFVPRLRSFLLELYKSLDGFLTREESDMHLYLVDTVANDIVKFRSPDTLARAFTLTGKKDELIRLKCLISSFIIYEQLEKYEDGEALKKMTEEEKKYVQSIYNNLDSRYLSFLATIIELDAHRVPKLPSNVNVVSWNYDNQIERAYQEYCPGNKRLFEVQDEINAFPKVKIDNSKKPSIGRLVKQFNLIKLNGTSAFTSKDHDEELFDFKTHVANKESFEIIKELLFSRRSNYKNRLHFAWEDELELSEDASLPFSFIRVPTEADRAKMTELQEGRFRAMKLFERSDIIVVIGYSFPDFNRRVDKDIFSKFRGKLVIQSPEAEKVSQKIKGVNPEIKEIETLTETDSFHIPYEFWEN